MIKSFRSKGLQELWETGRSGRVTQDLQRRALRRLDALDQAQRPEDMNVPGFDFHPLKGRSVRYTVHVNGPWCITFESDRTDAIRVDFE